MVPYWLFLLPCMAISAILYVTVQGYVEVRLCPNNNVAQDPDQDCFDRPGAALEVAGTGQVHI